MCLRLFLFEILLIEVFFLRLCLVLEKFERKYEGKNMERKSKMKENVKENKK